LIVMPFFMSEVEIAAMGHVPFANVALPILGNDPRADYSS